MVKVDAILHCKKFLKNQQNPWDLYEKTSKMH